MGINTLNTLGPRTFPALALGIVHIIRETCPTTPITVVSPISYPPNETEPSATGNTMETMRTDLEEVVRRLADRDGDSYQISKASKNELSTLMLAGLNEDPMTSLIFYKNPLLGIV